MRPMHLHCKAPRAWMFSLLFCPALSVMPSISNLQGTDLRTFSTIHLITYRGTAEMWPREKLG
jgi:hypothetical protein